MRIFLVNHSRQFVICSVDDGNVFGLAPGGEAAVICRDSGQTQVSLKHNEESHCEKRGWWSSNTYHLALDSTYVFGGLSNGDEIQITREKMNFCLDTAYDRFFAKCLKAFLISENHVVSGAECMLMAYRKEQRREFLWETVMDFLLEPLLYATGLNLLIFLVFLVMGGWVILPYIILISFVVLLLGNALARLIWRLILKVSGRKTETEEFREYLTNDYIRAYYSCPNRTPYVGACETE